MNQILFTYEKNNHSSSIVTKENKPIIFKFMFVICTIITISIGLYYVYSLYENNKKENISHKLINNFSITTLYSNVTPYSASKTSTR